MTLGQFKKMTKGLSNDIEVYIYVEDILHSICLEDSGVLTLRNLNNEDEDVIALSVSSYGEAKSTINLN
jgi:hypothetical protein